VQIITPYFGKEIKKFSTKIAYKINLCFDNQWFTLAHPVAKYLDYFVKWLKTNLIVKNWLKRFNAAGIGAASFLLHLKNLAGRQDQHICSSY
jgi:hypothetical protein